MHTKKSSQFLPAHLLQEIRNKFYYVDSDPYEKRLYFENAGGSLTLKSVVDLIYKYGSLPDSPNRPSLASQALKKMVEKGIEDVKLFLGAKDGKIIADETASRLIFMIVGTILENVPGTNVVTTFLEHPANYDACSFHAKRTGKELRVANPNIINGSVDPKEILSKIDKDTCLLSFIASSNITGKNLKIKKIVEEARKIKPDLFIFLDAVQYVAHFPTDVEEWGVDGIAFNQYKVFGKRTMGLGWVSKRVSVLAHEKFLEKPVDEWDLGGSEPTGYGAWSSVVDYICWIGSHFTNSKDRRSLILSGMESIMLQERALLEYALNGSDGIKGLRKLKHVNINWFPEDEDLSTRALLLPISVKGKSIGEVSQYYLKNGIVVFERVRSNTMSRRILDSLKCEGIIRVTPLHCNSKEEIDRFLEVTKSLV